MKRVKGKGATNPRVPGHHNISHTSRTLFFQTSSEWRSGCWHCPDHPCAEWATDEVTTDGPDLGSIDSSRSVCPTAAIQISGSGRPEIDEASCIGCGLCVMRCPVDAIRLDSTTSIAFVAPSLDTEESDSASFLTQRALSAQKLDWDNPPWPDAHLVSKQVLRFRTVLEERALLRYDALRLLLRNSFLLAVTPSKLRQQGANSSAVELTAKIGTRHVVAEIQPSTDTLDAFRRLLVGVADIVSNQSYDKSTLIPLISLQGLPNTRVDYYRLITAARKYLDLDIKTLPIAWIYLAIRNFGISAETLDALPAIEEGSESLGAPAMRRFGKLDAKSAGLEPRK